MSNALKKDMKFVPPRRGSEVVRPRPVEGDHKTQLDNAFAKTFERYERALEELAKV
ncbi:MAG: hypothetical protein AABY68_03175 [Pseudomonadota bacterium]